MRLFTLCSRCTKRETCTRNQTNVGNSCKLFVLDSKEANKQKEAALKLTNAFQPMLDVINDSYKGG